MEIDLAEPPLGPPYCQFPEYLTKKSCNQTAQASKGNQLFSQVYRNSIEFIRERNIKIIKIIKSRGWWSRNEIVKYKKAMVKLYMEKNDHDDEISVEKLFEIVHKQF